MRRLLPTPGSPYTVTRCARRSRAARSNVFSSSSSSDSRPISGATTAERTGVSERSAAQTTRHAASGSARPFTSIGSISSTSTASSASRRAAGPIRISIGRADCWSRAARLTASPVAKVDSALSTTTSPDSIPIRASSSSFLTPSRIPIAARIARSASSSWVCATPKAASTASPANFSTIPPCVVTQCETSSKNRVTRRRTTSGSDPETSAVEPTRSTKRTVASLRSTSEV